MLLRNALLSLVVTAAVAAVALGQQGNTTVQLPTFNITTAGTTVSVPDGGTGSLGGIMRAREGSVTRGLQLLSKGPFANRLFKNRGGFFGGFQLIRLEDPATGLHGQDFQQVQVRLRPDGHAADGDLLFL